MWRSGSRPGFRGEAGATVVSWQLDRQRYRIEPAMLEERVSNHRHQRMTMKAVPRPSLEVVETEFLLQLLMGLLANPSCLDRCG